MRTSSGYLGPPQAAQVGIGEASGCSLGAASWESAQTAQEKGRRTSVICQVAGCENLGLQEPSKYYLRFRICRYHSSLPQIMLGGKLVRFCQQCGRFEDLANFESGMKSCRASLDKHNSRRKRRKVLTAPPPTTQAGADVAAAGAGGLAGAGRWEGPRAAAGAGTPAEAGAEAAVRTAAAEPRAGAAAGANATAEPASSPGDSGLASGEAALRLRELLPGLEAAGAAAAGPWSAPRSEPQPLLPHRKQSLPLRPAPTQPYLRMGSAPAPGSTPAGQPTAQPHTVNILRDLNLGAAQQPPPLLSPFAAAHAAAQQLPPAGGPDQTAALLHLISAMPHVLAGPSGTLAGLQQHSAPLPTSAGSTPEAPSPGSAAAKTLLQLLLLALAEEAQAAQAAEQAQREQLQASSLPAVLSLLLGQHSPPTEPSWPELQQRSSSLLGRADLAALASYSQSSLPVLGPASLPPPLPLPPQSLPLSVFSQAGLGALQVPAEPQGPSQEFEAAVGIVSQLLGRLPSQQHSSKHDAWAPPA